MSKASKACAFWFIRDGLKLLQCSKEDFDRAIADGKSVKYGCYGGKKMALQAEALEASRMELLKNPKTTPKFRATLTDPKFVIENQIITVSDSQFWVRESKLPKYLQ